MHCSPLATTTKSLRLEQDLYHNNLGEYQPSFPETYIYFAILFCLNFPAGH